MKRNTLLFISILFSQSLMAETLCTTQKKLIFVSKGLHETGLGPNNENLSRWQLTFQFPDVRWQYSDIEESGKYTCNEDSISLSFDNNTYHAKQVVNTIVLDGKVYKLAK